MDNSLLAPGVYRNNRKRLRTYSTEWEAPTPDTYRRRRGSYSHTECTEEDDEPPNDEDSSEERASRHTSHYPVSETRSTLRSRSASSSAYAREPTADPPETIATLDSPRVAPSELSVNIDDSDEDDPYTSTKKWAYGVHSDSEDSDPLADVVFLGSDDIVARERVREMNRRKEDEARRREANEEEVTRFLEDAVDGGDGSDKENTRVRGEVVDHKRKGKEVARPLGEAADVEEGGHEQFRRLHEDFRFVRAKSSLLRSSVTPEDEEYRENRRDGGAARLVPARFDTVSSSVAAGYEERDDASEESSLSELPEDYASEGPSNPENGNGEESSTSEHEDSDAADADYNRVGLSSTKQEGRLRDRSKTHAPTAAEQEEDATSESAAEQDELRPNPQARVHSTRGAEGTSDVCQCDPMGANTFDPFALIPIAPRQRISFEPEVGHKPIGELEEEEEQHDAQEDYPRFFKASAAVQMASAGAGHSKQKRKEEPEEPVHEYCRDAEDEWEEDSEFDELDGGGSDYVEKETKPRRKRKAPVASSSKQKAKPKRKSKLKPQPKPQPQLQPLPKPLPQLQPLPKPLPRLQPRSQPQLQPQFQLQPQPQPPAQAAPEGKYACLFKGCTLRTNNPKQRERCMNIHNRVKFPCPFCEVRCARFDSLKRHVRDVHPGKNADMCEPVRKLERAWAREENLHKLRTPERDDEIRIVIRNANPQIKRGTELWKKFC